MKRLCAASVLASLILISISLSIRGQENSSLDSKFLATDLEVPGAISLQLQRQPSTTRTQRGPLGTRWRHNWESRLSRAAGRVEIDDWAGVTSFKQVGLTLEYASASGERITFAKDGGALRRTTNATSEIFDAAGRLLERVYPRGGKVLLRYDAQGRLLRVEDSRKGSLLFITDPAGHVVRAESSSGTAVRYAYNKDDLTEVQINGGAPLRYAYDARGSLIKTEDPKTGTLDIAYDARERVSNYRRSDGSEQRIEYDDATNRKRVIEPDGATTVTQEDPEKRRTEVTDPLGHKSVIQFDEGGRPVSVTGPTGTLSRLSYDSSGRLLASEDALGRATRYEFYNDGSTLKAIIHADETRQEFEYDGDNNLTAVKIGGKIVSALTYNLDGSIASAKEPGAKERRFTYYPNGLVKTDANALGEATQFEYDARSNLVSETNPLGGRTVRTYDPQNRLMTLTNSAGATTRYEYDSRDRLIRETDPAGGVTTFEYDALGRLNAETNPAGQATRYEYTPVDKIARVIRPGNQTESYSYDLAGNLTVQTDHLGRTTKFEHDPAGQVVREKLPTGLEVRYRYDAAGNLVAVEDSSGAKSEYQVDAVGQTTARINPDGGKTQYRYDTLGNLLAVTDPLGRIKQFAHTYDSDLIQVVEPSRDEARYQYDAAGRIVSVRRPSGGVTSLTYDSMGNLLTVTDPLGNVKRYSYDNAGRLLSFTDAANRVTHYVYDKAGRTVEKQLPDRKRVNYKYDTLGRMIEADDGTFPVRISYDEGGRLKQVEYAAIKKAVAYEYDTLGLRTKMTAPNGYETRYEYDVLKRLSAVALPDVGKITINYDEKNRVQSVAYPNGITGRWVYDPSGRISKIVYQDKSGKAIATSAYRYDATGNPVEREDAPAQASRFVYDAANQLIEETNPAYSTKYRYAAGGNRAAVEEGERVSKFKHDAADRLIEAGAEQLTYDANGNLIGRKGPGGSVVYEYDAENRLVKVVMADGETTTFGYAPTGERVWRRGKSGITYFVYDGLNLIVELGDDLRTITSFVHGFGIDRPLAMLQEKQSYYYLADRLGSITHLTDNNGKIATAYTYDAFGKIRSKQGAIANPFAYTGRELDPTGLYYYRARYYDAALGRFLSNDLISARLEEPLEQNPYLYVRNGPVRFVDPLGLDAVSPESLSGQNIVNIADLGSESASGAAVPTAGINNTGAIGVNPLRANDRTGAFRPQPGGTTAAINGGSPNRAGANTGAVRPQVGGNTAAVNGGSPNRAGANTGAVRPEPGPPRGNTLQVNGPRPSGNTLVSPVGSGPSKGFWTINPYTVRPGISGSGTAASIIAAAADCYRRGLSNCGPKIATGLVIAGIARGIIGKAAGPVGTILAGGKAWWEIGKEVKKDQADQQQRDEQAIARQAQAEVNAKNRDAFNTRIEKLRARINALKKDQDTVTTNSPAAREQANIAREAAVEAEKRLTTLRLVKDNRELVAKTVCTTINASPPATIKSEIETLAAQAEAMQRESDGLLAEARQLGANCASAADVQGIRDRYNRIKSLPGLIDQLKKQGDQKNAALEKLRRIVEQSKGPFTAKVRTDIGVSAGDANKAAIEATRLVTQVRDSILVLEAGKKQLRMEINALQGAVPESVLADIQDRFNELHGLLSAVTTYPELVRYDDEALANAKSAGIYEEEAVRILQTWKIDFPCQTDIPLADAAIQRINTAIIMAGLNDAGDLLRHAQVCEASLKCIPVINKTRQLLEQLEIEGGIAGINQARQQGCNVEGLESALDYYRTIRDAAALLLNAKEQCKFEQGMAFAEKIPASIQNNPWVANGITELRAALAAKERVEQLITTATVAADLGSSLALQSRYEESRKQFAQADGSVAQANSVAALYSCLVERVSRYKGEYDRLKVAVNNNSGGKGATDDGSADNNLPRTGPLGAPLDKPTVEEIPEDADTAAEIISNINKKGPRKPEVEEIPEDSPGITGTINKKDTKKPEVEEIPEEDIGRTKTTSNVTGPGDRRTDQPEVEEIPEEVASNPKPRRPADREKPDVEEIPDEVVVPSQPQQPDAPPNEPQQPDPPLNNQQGSSTTSAPQGEGSGNSMSGPDMTGTWTRTLKSSGEELFECLNEGPQTYRDEISGRGNNIWRVRSTLLNSPCPGDYENGRVGKTVEYTLTVKNDGAGNVDVIVSDDQNRGMSARASYNGSQLSFTQSGGRGVGGSAVWTWTRQ